ncbi:hypothetical protein RRF57_007723 [Xylaria bambusicola]|uniref:Uncharacterized protein n=1 Tax=Xylaria bambusicola TaxID=326684 RepID=A0AAN7UVT2_9PEZI
MKKKPECTWGRVSQNCECISKLATRYIIDSKTKLVVVMFESLAHETRGCLITALSHVLYQCGGGTLTRTEELRKEEFCEWKHGKGQETRLKGSD